VGAHGRGLAAAQARHLGAFAAPTVRRARVDREIALRRLYPIQRTVANAHHAANPYLPDALALGDDLVVLLALPIAVEDLRDGGVAPIHDPQAGPDAGGSAQAEIALFAAFA
jgi:hypothetical protein